MPPTLIGGAGTQFLLGGDRERESEREGRERLEKSTGDQSHSDHLASHKGRKLSGDQIINLPPIPHSGLLRDVTSLRHTATPFIPDACDVLKLSLPKFEGRMHHHI